MLGILANFRNRARNTPALGVLEILRTTLNNLSEQLAAIGVPTEDDLDDQIRALAAFQRERKTREVLSTIGVDALEQRGISSRQLTLGGYETIAQLLDVETGQLSFLDSDNERGAIVSTVEGIQDEVVSITPCLPTEDEDFAPYDELVRNLIIMLRLPQMRTQAESIQSTVLDITRNLDSLAAECDRARFAFAGRTECDHLTEMISQIEERLSTTTIDVNSFRDEVMAIANAEDRTTQSFYWESLDEIVSLATSIAGSPAFGPLPVPVRSITTEIECLRSDAIVLVDKLNAMPIPNAKDLSQEIISLVRTNREAIVSKLLAQIEITALEPLGIDVTKLNLAGITTAEQLYEVPPSSFPFSEDNAQMRQVRSVASQLHDTAFNLTPCIIKPNEADAAADIICAVICMDQTQTLLEKRDELLVESSDFLKACEARLHEDDLRDRMVVPGDIADASRNETMQLRQRMEDLTSAVNELGRLIRTLRPSREQASARYNTNSEGFDDKISSITGEPVGGHLPLVTTEISLRLYSCISRFETIRVFLKRVSLPWDCGQKLGPSGPGGGPHVR